MTAFTSYRIFIPACLILIWQCGFAQIPAGYYNNAANKTGETLRASLRDITTNGAVKIPYTSSSFDIWDAYGQTDVRPGTNIIWDMYSDVPGGSPAYNYTLYTNQCGTASSEGDCYAREHQVPNSWWGGLDDAAHPQYSDLHMLPPADQYVNNYKSAHPIGKVGSATYTSSNGSKVGSCSWPGYSGIVFEPIDEYKGDFARAYLYVATRYMNQLSSWVTSYPTTEAQYVITSTGNNYKQWFIDMLVQWTIIDPVSQKELDRNDAIYYNTPQRNRNPYIDHPEYVCLVWSSSSCVSGPTISSVSQSPSVVTSTSPVSITATVSSSVGVSSVTVEWGTDGINFPNAINATQVGSTNDYLADSSIPAKASGVTVYFRIIAEDIQASATTSSVRSYTVLKNEPTNYPTAFACGTVTGSAITLTWVDATGASLPDGYLIKASAVSLAAITDPVDSIPEVNGSFVKNVAYGVQQAVFSGLGSSTVYYFKIYPYSNSGTNINYKKTASPPSASCTTAVVTGGSSCATDLIISEYVEGSANNKYIEVYNNTGFDVNLSDYKLQLYANGSATVTSEMTLSGILNNLATIVFKNSSATIYSGTATASAVINFNGDDAVALYKISTASYVDIFGRIGEDPGTNWASGSIVTVDKTLVRNADVFGGVTVNPSSGFPTLGTQWTQYNLDDVTHLGTHTMSCPSCSSPALNSSSISFSSVSETGMTISWTKGDGAKRLVVMSDGSSVSGSPETGVTYSANSVFGTGDTLGHSEYVVYNGTGSTVSVTGLSGGHTYYVTVFEYNCAVGYQVYLTPGFSSSKITYSITTGDPSEGQYCVTSINAAPASVDYSSTGTFSSNTFSVQLSDSAGSFASPVTIGTFSSNAATGTINCSIPAGTPAGTGYRMRVKSSNPVVTGSASGAFQVILSPVAVAPSSVNSDRSGFCPDDTGTIILTAIGGSGTELKWYSGNCGGTYLGNSNPLVIPSPTVTTTYYALYGTTCSNSSCTSVTVQVNGMPPASAGVAIASCTGTAAILMTGATNDAMSNAWSGGTGLGTWIQNSNPSLASFTPSVPAGSFIATLTVYASGNCLGLYTTYTRKISWGSSGSWTGASSIDWTNASNWCGGVPTSSRDVYIPPAGHVLNSPAISASGAVCLSMALSGNLTFTGTAALDVYGNWQTTDGSVTASSGTVTFRGASKTISGNVPCSFPAIRFNSASTYTMSNSNSCSSFTIMSGNTASTLTQSAGANLTINGNAVVNQLSNSGSGTNIWNIGASAATIAGNLTIGSGSSNSSRVAKIILSGGTLTIGGNLSFNAGSTTCAVLDLSGGASQVNLAGTLTKSSAGTLTPGNLSSFNFNGSGVSQTVTLGTGFSYFNVLVNNTSASGAVLGGTVSTTNVLGNILIQSGMLANGGYAVTGNASRQFSIGDNCTYKLTAATTMPAGFGSVNIGNNSTVEFGGTSGQTIPALNYSNLTSSSTGARTFASSGIIGISGVFSPGSNTFTSTGSTVNFTGSNQVIPAISGTAGYNHLTVAQSTGTASISGNVKISGTLTLSSGNLDLGGSGILTLAGSNAIGGSPFSATKMIFADGGGEIRKNFSANGSYVFPVGDNNGTPDYSPVTLNFSSGTYAAGAYASVKVFNAKHPQNSNGNNYLNRYWTIDNSAITNPVFSVTATYVAGDVVGSDNGIFTSRYTGSLPWTQFSAANTVSRTLTASSQSVTGSADYSGISSGSVSVSISGGNTSVCSGDSVSLSTVVTGTGPFIYSWSPSTGINDTASANPIVYPSSTSTYTVTVTGEAGSVAVASTTITVLPRPAATVSPAGPLSICRGTTATLTAGAGASYLWNTGATGSSIVVSEAGNYYVTLTGSNGCTNVSNPVAVSVRENSAGSESIMVCSSTLPFLWHGSYYYSGGNYQAVLPNAAGCDSVITLYLTVLPSSVISDTVQACYYYVLPWSDTVTVSGTYSRVLAGGSSNGCDSIVSITVNLFQGAFEAETVAACGSYSWHGSIYTQSGDYIYHYSNANGCLSADTLHLTVSSGTYSAVSVTACNSYLWNGVTYTQSGTYVFNYVNASGCPSADTLYLLINKSSHQVTTESACVDYLWAMNGTTYSSSGTYTYSYINSGGCASVDTLKLSVYPGTSSAVTASGCDAYTWSLNGQTYTQSGSYTNTGSLAVDTSGGVRISQVYGGGGGSTGTYQRDYIEIYNSKCSAVDISGWTLEYGSATGTWGSSAGNIFTFPAGTYIQPKKYLLVQCGSKGTAGAVLPVSPDFSTDTLVFNISASNGKIGLFRAANSNLACGSELAGTLVDKVSYGTGNCPEGTAAVALTATTVIVRKNAGETDNGNNSTDFQSVSAVGISIHNSASSANSIAPCSGCQRSILQLTIQNSQSLADTVSACDNYQWPANGVVYTQSGNYTYVNGCVTNNLALQLNKGSHNVIAETACGSYSWHGVNHTQSGVYTYSYQNTSGCASVDTLYLTIHQGTYNAASQSACNSYYWNGITYTQSGIYTYYYLNSFGCPSTDTLHLTVNYGSGSAVLQTACGSYLWHGSNYSASGSYTYDYVNGQGCASTDTLILTVEPLPDAGVISGPASLSVGASGNYSSSGDVGGLWYSANPGVINIDSISGQATAISIGNSSLMYVTPAGSCGQDTSLVFVTVSSSQTVINLKLFIEGFYVSSDSMRPVLYNSGVAGADEAWADTVFVELHDAANGNLTAGPVAGMLATDGSLSVNFPFRSGSEYIAIRHRNTLETWSAIPVVMGAVVNYDFSVAADKAYGSNQIQVGPGQFAFRSGDLNQDGVIESFDYSEMENDIISILFGYHGSDLTGDGVVESSDYALIENNIIQILFSLKPF